MYKDHRQNQFGLSFGTDFVLIPEEAYSHLTSPDRKCFANLCRFVRQTELLFCVVPRRQSEHKKRLDTLFHEPFLAFQTNDGTLSYVLRLKSTPKSLLPLIPAPKLSPLSYHETV